jgi:hypothetical protein
MTKARSNATAPNAKGTLVVGNGTDASTTLAVASTAGYVLTVDSAEATGLKWAAAGSGFRGCSVSHSATISTSNDTWTIMPMDTEAFDTDNFHSTTTNNSRITIPSGLAGKYLIICRLRWDQNATGARNTGVYKNGSLINWVNYAPTPTWGGGGSWPSTPWISIQNLSVGDYLEAAGMQQSGGTLNGLSTWEFSVQYLGA